MAQKKRIRALNADGDVTWCSADVMGAKGCNHLAHGTETEVEAAQIEFFMGDSGVSAVITSDSSALPTSSNEAQDLQIFKEKQRLDDLLAKKGFTEEHLRFLADPNSGQVLMDADYQNWRDAPLSFSKDSDFTPKEKQLMRTRLKAEDYEVFRQVTEFSSDPETLEMVFERIIADEFSSLEQLTRLLAKNSHVSKDMLIKLYEAIDKHVGSKSMKAYLTSAFVDNPNTPATLLPELVKKDITGIGYYGIDNLNMPSQLLSQYADLAAEGKIPYHHHRFSALINHPNLSKEDFNKIYKSNIRSRMLLIGSVHMDSKTLENIIERYDNDLLKIDAAANPNLSVDKIEEIANMPNSNLKYGIAKNPSTPTEILEKLHKENNVHINNFLVLNPNLPEYIFTELAEKKKIADNSRLGVRYEDRFAKSVSSNPNAPVHILEQLVAHKDEDVRFNVASNPNSPPELLAKLAQKPGRSKYQEVRFALIRNKNLPMASLGIMTKKNVPENVRNTAISVTYLRVLG